MLKVCIVDDELHMRRTVRALGNWSRWNMEVFEAENGKDALTLIRSVRPHIVIMDMNMPIMDGKTLMENLKGENCKVIVISGYDDFHYMRHAITHNAVDYLLKPISRTDLNEALRKAVEKIYIKNRVERHLQLKQYVGRLLWNDHYDISRICFDIEEIDRDGWDQVQLKLFICRNFSTACKRRFGNDSNLLMFTIENVLLEQFSTIADTIIIPSMTGKCEFVVLLKQWKGGTDSCRHVVQELYRFMNATLGLDFIHVESECFKGTENIRKHYRSLYAHILQKRLNPGVPADETDQPVVWIREKEFNHCVNSATTGQLKLLIQRWARELYDNPRMTILSAYHQFTDCMKAIHGISGLPGDGTMLPVKLETFMEFGLQEDSLFSYLWKEARKVKHWIESSQPKSDIERVAEFLREQHAENISLDDLANRFHFSKSYLCKAFKKRYHCTIMEYVIKYRLELAKSYMRDRGYRAQSAAEFAGFRDYPYFSRLYKKRYGYPPSLEGVK